MREIAHWVDGKPWEGQSPRRGDVWNLVRHK